MPSPLSKDSLETIEERAVSECVDLVLDVTKQFVGPDGDVYGDVDFKSPAEFVMFWIDLVSRGVDQHLQVVAPHFYERWATRYQRDSLRLMTGGE